MMTPTTEGHTEICPCCHQQTPFELLPNRRRLGTLHAATRSAPPPPSALPPMPFPVSAASATTYPGISAPSVPRAGGAMLTAEQLASKGTVRLLLSLRSLPFFCSAPPCSAVLRGALG